MESTGLNVGRCPCSTTPGLSTGNLSMGTRSWRHPDLALLDASLAIGDMHIMRSPDQSAKGWMTSHPSHYRCSPNDYRINSFRAQDLYL